MKKPGHLAGLFAAFNCSSGVSQMQGRLPKHNPSADADVDALLHAILGHFQDGVADFQNVLGHTSYLVAQDQSPFFVWIRTPFLQRGAAFNLFHSGHFPPLFLKRFDRIQRALPWLPRNMPTGTQGTFQNVPVRGVAGDATQV